MEIRTCGICSKQFRFLRPHSKRPNIGKFCSRRCAAVYGGSKGGRPRTYSHLDTERKCGICKEVKAISCFGVARRLQDGIQRRCKDCLRAKDKKRYHSDPAYHVQRRTAQRRMNPKHTRDYNTAYRKANPEKHKGYAAKRRVSLAYREYYRRYISAWLKTPKGRHSKIAKELRRRAREHQAPGNCSNAALQARIDFYGGRCWVCRAPYQAVDHVKPLSKGGSHWPSNLRPICKPCNSKKSDRWPFHMS